MRAILPRREPLLAAMCAAAACVRRYADFENLRAAESAELKCEHGSPLVVVVRRPPKMVCRWVYERHVTINGPPGRPRRDRDFVLFWGGQAVSLTGATVSEVALPLLAVLTLRTGPVGLGVL